MFLLFPQKHFELEESFKSKIVEDGMHEFRKNCVTDHPACSMIIYTEDDAYLKNDVFTKEELQEIAEKDPIDFTTPIPKPLADYMNKYKIILLNFVPCRQKLNTRKKNYNMSRDHDFGWVKLIIFLYACLYESGELDSKQLET